MMAKRRQVARMRESNQETAAGCRVLQLYPFLVTEALTWESRIALVHLQE